MKIRSKWMGLTLLAMTGAALAQDVGPTQEQELRDAKTAIEAAQKGPAVKHAGAQIQSAQDSVLAAEEARKQKSGERFGRAARLARAYAELAMAVGDHGEERQNVVATNEAAKNARADIERLGAGAKP